MESFSGDARLRSRWTPLPTPTELRRCAQAAPHVHGGEGRSAVSNSFAGQSFRRLEDRDQRIGAISDPRNRRLVHLLRSWRVWNRAGSNEEAQWSQRAVAGIPV